LFLILVGTGCDMKTVDTKEQISSDSSFNTLTVYANYAPVKIEIVPLTEIVYADNAEEESKVVAYVSLLDSFGSHVKMPGVFRFELYERVARSAEPKGRRIVLWPDTDLSGAAENNKFWRDFLRAYEFIFTFKSQSNQCYILQATYLSPNGKRLLAEFSLKCTE
jgi:hypothetical protein